MFEKLTFASPREEEDFEKYKKLKGVYLHKQVYDILLEANGGENVTYYELSSIIRYDKILRDTLYIYLATAEEYLRALLCEKYDVAEDCKLFERHCSPYLMEALHDKEDATSSNLYFKLEPDFSALMDVCIDKGVISISKTTKQRIKDFAQQYDASFTIDIWKSYKTFRFKLSF